MQCGRHSVWNTDPVFISAGTEKSVHAGPKCYIHGPTGRSEPFGAVKDIGPYIGCLVIGPEGKTDGEVVLISSAEPDATCD